MSARAVESGACALVLESLRGKAQPLTAMTTPFVPAAFLGARTSSAVCRRCRSACLDASRCAFSSAEAASAFRDGREYDCDQACMCL